MNFEQFGLDARLVGAVKTAGYVTPTPIQQQAIPVVLEGRDVLGLAQTGTGKTAAFVLPILHRLINSPFRVNSPSAPIPGRRDEPRSSRHHGHHQPPRPVRVLILAPTRELAEQIHEAIGVFAAGTDLRSLTIYGGVGKARQLEGLRRGADIIVACPGRLLEHLGEGSVNLKDLEVLVLDEADRMCDMGFLPDIKRVLKYVPAKRQTLFFSATMPDDIRSLSANILSQPVTVQVGILAPVKTVEHALYPVPESQKTPLLLAMLEMTPTGRVLVFTRTKHRAKRLALELAKHDYRVQALQGNMAQNRRQEAITGFREGKYDILVATDIAARGIDVSDVSHVINFDMPDTVDAYTHRIGRTGRAAATGEAFTFSQPADEPLIRAVEKVLGAPIERRRLSGFAYGPMAAEPTTQPKPAQRNGSRPNGARPERRPERQPNDNGQRNGAGESPRNGSNAPRREPRPGETERPRRPGPGEPNAQPNGPSPFGTAVRDGAAGRPPRRRRGPQGGGGSGGTYVGFGGARPVHGESAWQGQNQPRPNQGGGRGNQGRSSGRQG